MENLTQKTYNENLKIDLFQEKEELKGLKGQLSGDPEEKEQLTGGPKDTLDAIIKKIKELNPDIDTTGDFTKEYTKCMGFKSLVITKLGDNVTIMYDEPFDKKHWIRYINDKFYISDDENKRGMKMLDANAKIRLTEIYSKIEDMAKRKTRSRPFSGDGGGDGDGDGDGGVIIDSIRIIDPGTMY